MIKNFVFDLGKVIVEFDPVELTDKYVTDKSNLKKISEAAFSREIFDKLDSGEFTDSDGRNYLIDTFDKSLLDEALLAYDNWMNNLKVIDGMKNLIEEIKNKGYKIYLLSNVTAGFKEKYKTIDNVYEVLKNFDGLVISGDVKMIKPDKEIYEYLLNEFDLKANECIFIDDRKENTDAAINCGLNAYTFNGDVRKLKEYIENSIY